ncbi:hypothetical protein TpMuguga_04g00630 [Theileria parva strain Muguga]|uniref:Mitochondrial carrier protein n=1 Tax=Theileria parva TaxID=5875 RepID=Q4N1U7_THEPA|nr:uncharacterized protein TpMuguga_04g00630 [Theileria parva strain Muguga]EAN31982.1 hypothetical protein TpMuguga_04g00630 [Theileria parva strain Muguga]|eukprot:XP_764265.1 hypothetical protein [Theileria parva strain Muguga]
MTSDSLFSDRPRKIIITLTPSFFFNHPLTVLGNKISVLRFQRSLCDPYSTSNGFLRELDTEAVGAFPAAYSLFFVKDLAVSIYKNEGILGFFKCLPEYIAYHLTKDLLRYLVPNFLLPIFPKIFGPLPNKIKFYNILDTNNNIRLRYIGFLDKNSQATTSKFFNFYFNQVESELNKIVTSFIVELITYPALTIISRMIIYDGYGPVSFHLLFKHTLSVDGLLSLYRGFSYHLLSNIIKYIIKHFNRFVQRTLVSDFYLSPMFEQSVPVVLSISQSVLNQFSLIRRCGSKIDGFCIEESSVNIFRQMPWISIFTQMVVTIGLIHLRDKLVTSQIQEFNSQFAD